MKKNSVKILFMIMCIMSLVVMACGKKANDNAGEAQQAAVPADAPIDANALLGSWTQIVDSDPDVYTFLADGKCTLSNSVHKTPRECTYELKPTDKGNDRFNKLIIHYPAMADEEAYDNIISIRLSGDKLDFPDNEGNVSEYNKYKKTDDSGAAPAKAEEAAAYTGNIEEDILGEWSEEVSEGPTVTYKFMPEGKCTFQDVMHENGVDCTYKVSPDSDNKFKLVVTREDALGGMKDFEESIEFKDGNLYFYLDNHPYKYNKK